MQASLICFLFGILGTVLAGRPPFTVKQPTFYRDPTSSSSSTLPRGGDMPSGVGSLSSFCKKVKSSFLDAPQEETPKTDSIWKVAGNFFQKQTAAAQERRDFYQENADEVQVYAKNLLKQNRILKLTVVAFVVAEMVEFISGNQGLQSFWTSTLHPALVGHISQVNVWWTKGRGLFQQFSPKFQRIIGLAAGLILSPVLWSLTSVAGVYLGAGIAVVELNHYVGERIQEILDPLSVPLSQGWHEIDNALEQVHGCFRDLLKRPTQLVHLPVQQGVLVGALLGFVAEI